MKKLLLIAGAASVALMGASAFAGSGKDWGAKAKAKIEKLDTDGDGIVTEAEFTSHGERYTAEKFAKIAGDDGEMTADDLKKYMKKKYAKKHKEHSKKEKH